MSNDRLILCGGLSKPHGATQGKPIELDLWGNDRNVALKIKDISQRLAANIPDRLADLLEVATYIYAADQAITRGGDGARNLGANWRRRFEFHIPVREPDIWSSKPVLDALVETIGFLSEDEYDFKFHPLAVRPHTEQYFEFGPGAATGFSPESVILFSGGLDSFSGAVQEVVQEKRRVLLVSHRSSTKLSSNLEHLVADLQKLCTTPPLHIPVWINKEKELGKEYTQRTRSFLYASLGAVVARLFDLWGIRFYENGILSLNLPISAQVVGARATRTTHPQALNGFARIFTALFGRAFTVENPFLWKTKTEIVSSIVQANCGELIRHTVSCTRTWQRTKLHTHCGRCSQCIDRRFAIMAAGCSNMDPEEMYAVDLFTGAREEALDKTMAESYVRTATEISKMNGNGTEFFSKFGEATRVLRHLSDHGTTDQVASKVLDLHKRHAGQVCKAISDAFGKYGPDLHQGTLPETCLIALALPEKYRQRGKTHKPVTKFPTPPGSTWEQVSMHVLDGNTVRITINGVSEIRHYNGMGMNNDKNGQPDRTWNLLMKFADERGHLTWHSTHADRKNQKRKEDLAKRLQAFFGIHGDPFIFIPKSGDGASGWQTRFQITPP